MYDVCGLGKPLRMPSVGVLVEKPRAFTRDLAHEKQ